MDERLVAYYNSELHHLREMAGEFAREFPKIAGRLALDRDAKEICPDPYVERLLEGFAFLAARVHLKLDAEFPRFTQTLLETIYPHYLAPVPAMGVAHFEPDPREPGPEEGFLLERGTALRSEDEDTRCQFRTAHDLRLWPLWITEARYYTRDIVALELPGALEAKAGAITHIAPRKLGCVVGLGFVLEGLRFVVSLPGLLQETRRTGEETKARLDGYLTYLTFALPSSRLCGPSAAPRVAGGSAAPTAPPDASSGRGLSK